MRTSARSSVIGQTQRSYQDACGRRSPWTSSASARPCSVGAIEVEGDVRVAEWFFPALYAAPNGESG
ncbi:hypothetical protein DKT68_03620 [Micromonospora acroterricola]|uniref:Uncharacterized protein n=1 Tax=Micromonospora acroterricola TaxID=2202421 RepID=A0A317DBP9_9ACTN|nr:hypothetical protein DKT68_03620 [Micromonospora acroterricola]